MPHRARYLLVCTNRRAADHPKGSCAARGAEALVPALKAALNARGLALTARACGATCLDLCEIGAAILQEPDHVAYGNVRAEDIDALADAVASGGVLERLVVHRG
jgi:(2Fe-2S) ferredoxin